LAVQGVDRAQEGVNEGIVCISQFRLPINAHPPSHNYDTLKLKRRNTCKFAQISRYLPGCIQIVNIALCL
jgi:hypothetical protein